MKVGMLTGSLARGGSERVMVNIAEYLVNRGHTVTIVTQFERENEFKPDRRIKRIVFGLTKDEEKGRIRSFKRRIDKLTDIWRREKPDVILSFIGKNNFMAIYTGHKIKIPVAVSVRAPKRVEYYNKVMTFLADHYLGRAEAVVLQGPGIIKDFPKNVEKKAIILKNPINNDFFGKAYDGEREKTIITVGRPDKEKNQKLLIDAFMGIADRYPDWKLILYGDGVFRQEYLSFIEEKGFSDRIFMPGQISDVIEKIKKAGVFVLSSNSEGAPNVLIEAMILGLPCISTDCPIGVPGELITHGVNGLLTPVGDTLKMQENLQILLDNIQKRNKIGMEARKTADIYAPEKVLSEWEELLSALVAKKPFK